MLNLFTTERSGPSRREFLRVGSLAAGGLSLPDVLRQRAKAETSTPKTAVIHVFLCGGPSQHDTFDPKPDGTEEGRPFDSIATALPGVRITEFFPKLATMLDQCTLLRSLHHGDGSHNHSVHWMQTGYYPQNFILGTNHHPAFGCIASKYRGPNRPGLPPYVAIPDGYFYSTAAYLGNQYNPLDISDPNKPDFHVPNLQFAGGITADRLDDRRRMLNGLDRFRRDLDTRGNAVAMDAFHAAALDMLSGPAVRQAFDINAEDPRLRDRYGRNRLGQGCLLARRLVEAGVTFVTVKDYEFYEWDFHGTGGGPGIVGTKTKAPHLDAALSSLLLDLTERGRIDRVLVKVVGEFGRTPNINGNAGRDHWGNVFTALLAGGGLRHGQVIGSSDAKGAVPQDRPLDPADLFATMYRVLGISPHEAPPDYSGRPIPLLPGGEPIRELFG